MRRSGAAEVLVFVLAILVHGMPAFLGAVPPPSVHDEFAYLLAADTFARGRLSNPPHPLWEHFETFHTIHHPTYMAKFPAGQGLALAAGQVLIGMPIVGVLVTVALGCAAICWMIRAWAPPHWALFGGLLAVFHPRIFWWSQIYWGGGVALLGGALFVGAALRAIRHPTIAYGLVAGAGLGILLLSRPFEGAILAMLLAVILMIPLRRRLDRIAALAKGPLVGVTVVLVPLLAWSLYYNWRVTGQALTMPYVVHARQYMAAPLFWWQRPPAPPVLRNEKLRHFYHVLEYGEYESQARSPRAFFQGIVLKTKRIVESAFQPAALAAMLVGLPWALRRRATRVALVVCVLLPALHMFCTPWMRIQYFAPAGGLFIALLVLCARALARWRWGAAIVGIVLILEIVSVGIMIHQMAGNPNPTGSTRARYLAQLHATPGKHLVLVRYGPDPQHLFEWVNNEAEIDASRVVFAHDLGPASNRRLFDYFSDRESWLLSVDVNRVDLTPLPRPAP